MEDMKEGLSLILLEPSPTPLPAAIPGGWQASAGYQFLRLILAGGSFALPMAHSGGLPPYRRILFVISHFTERGHA
jgi:hypothetical protein